MPSNSKSTVSFLAKKIRIKNELVRETFAEFLGCLVLTVFGSACNAQVILSKGQNGNVVTQSMGNALAVCLALYTSLGISGGHINPSVSIALAIINKFPLVKVPAYILAQYMGCFVGAGITYVLYREPILSYESNTSTIDTIGIFATVPRENLTIQEGLVDQITGTGLLLLVVMALSDKKNCNVPMSIFPPLISILIFCLNTSVGLNCGSPINPARDLSPRMFMYVAGWGTLPFSFMNFNYWYIPVVGPIIGAILGSWIYLLFVEFHHPEDENCDEEDMVQAQYVTSNGELVYEPRNRGFTITNDKAGSIKLQSIITDKRGSLKPESMT